MEGVVTLNQKEQRRLVILNKVEKSELTLREATELLDLSGRHIQRLKAAYRKDGAAALAHGNRGRRPSNALDEGVKLRVIQIAGSTYAGFNTQHLTEMLAEREGLPLSRSTVRRFLLQGGLSSPRKRRPPKHRSRRERYPQEGMLLQIDGSRHDWLEGRGEWLSLVGAIDDAVGTVPWALFRYEEDTVGYFLLLKEIVQRYGIPIALYHDRHSIFELSPDKLPSIEEQLAGQEALTQFGRLLTELGITSISARSPQAKGRIERLWGTFQDRLVSELRLAGVRTLEEANRVLWDFLPHFNAKFGVTPAREGVAYRKPESSFKPEAVFCLKYWRTVGADNVARFGKERLQIFPSMERLSYARSKVEIHLWLDGSLKVYYQGKYLITQPAPVEAVGLRPMVVAGKSEARHRYSRPAPDHPWRGIYRASFDK